MEIGVYPYDSAIKIELVQNIYQSILNSTYSTYCKADFSGRADCGKVSILQYWFVSTAVNIHQNFSRRLNWDKELENKQVSGKYYAI